MAYSFTPQMGTEYQQLFDSCRIKEDKYPEVDACIKKIMAAQPRYEAVASKTGIPWYFISIVHNMEASGNFNCHLHNGDPLTARTVQVPKGYPKTGNPPFTWEVSAEDSLRLKALDQWTNWSIPGLLFQLERYNGFGYRGKGIYSPYLWSYSNHYTKGKYVADGSFSPTAVSRQMGAAVLLRRLQEKQLTGNAPDDLVTRIKRAAESVVYAPSTFSADASQLQALLNNAGMQVRVDGYAGKMTSDALKQLTGSYLKGDNRP